MLRSHPILAIGFAAALAAQLVGFTLSHEFKYFDKVMHFFMPLFAAPLLYLVIVGRRIQRLTGSVGEIIFATFLFGATAAVLWEVVEFAIDPWTSKVWQPSVRDTMLDLIAGLCGSIGGGTFLALRRRDYLPYMDSDLSDKKS